MNKSPVNTIGGAAPLKNVALFATLLAKVVDRASYLPGMACFYGFSGLGKSKAASFGANRHRAVYVECGQFESAKSLLTKILIEYGVERPRGTVTSLIDEAVYVMAGNVNRPLLVDEAHHIAAKRFVDVLRELHDKSGAPVILIGEETLPGQLEAFERVHNRMLAWERALPCDSEDFFILAEAICPGLAIGQDLAEHILRVTRGNTRRITVNLAEAQQRARRTGAASIDLAGFGGPEALVGISAPKARGY